MTSIGRKRRSSTRLKKNSKDLKQAMSRLNFYINRTGKNIDKKEKDKLDGVKEKLRKLFD